MAEQKSFKTRVKETAIDILKAYESIKDLISEDIVKRLSSCWQAT